MGYLLVNQKGQVASFGSVVSYGGVTTALNKPIVAMAADPATGGYWLLGGDGGVFSFNAPFYGSTGTIVLAKPCVGMTSMPSGNGYRFVAADGGIFDFGGAGFYGSAAGTSTSGASLARHPHMRLPSPKPRSGTRISTGVPAWAATIAQA